MQKTAVIIVGLLVLTGSTPAKADPFFRTSVAPIFEQNCIRCHRGSNAKGGLDLTQRKGLVRGGDSGPTIVAGSPDDSLLLFYVSGEDPEMPKNGDPLRPEQVAALRQWIADGARWPDGLVLKENRSDWWSLKPLRQPDLPKLSVNQADWVRTPIDAFVAAQFEKHGLSPSPEADRRTLIRRLTFNLHGLPPTPEEVDAFVHDSNPRAYENLVDRLLDSPRYGERWARHWLDVVHYGDTHGYDKDKRRPNAWPYRDYVIRSLNADKPYGRFVREQVAGDVLFADDPDGIVATGFLVAGPWDFVGHVELREGTTDKKIARLLDRDDIVMNTMSTFTSLTVHCARCHDHKFDPITQEDYYSLQAVFAGIERAERPYDVDAATARKRRKLYARENQLVSRRQAIEDRIRRFETPEMVRIAKQIESLNQQIESAAALPDDLKQRTLGYHSRIMPSSDATKWVQVDLGRPVSIEQIILLGAHVAYGGHPGPGFGFPPRFKIEASNDAEFRRGVTTIADQTQADYPHPGNIPVAFVPADATQARYVRVTATKLWERTNDYIFALSELVVLSAGVNPAQAAPVTALDSIEAGESWGQRFLTDGMFARMKFDDPAKLLERFAESMQWELERRQLQAQYELLRSRSIDDATRRETAEIDAELSRIRAEIDALPDQQMVYAVASDFPKQGNFTPPPNGRPRPIYLLQRGSVTAPGPELGPGTVSCLEGLPSRFQLDNPDDEGARRAALADWIADERNPLTWRSIVNRVWHYHFGRGLVDTPNDFGRMGSRPTHPELLDWLAVEFRDGGQSLKDLHRLIVTSAVYRQESAHRPDMAQIDASNRFLWRMNRRRLEAEAVRDTVLAVSGTLNGTMYGPGFDLFEFEDDHSPRYLYAKHDVDDRETLRRTIYRFIVRSVPDPFMESLDCADPSASVPVRNTTITALQALSLLNNPFMVRQAEHFAARVARNGGGIPQQIRRAFRLAFSRQPAAEELESLTAYAREHGMANTCRVIFNMNEFLFVD